MRRSPFQILARPKRLRDAASRVALAAIVAFLAGAAASTARAAEGDALSGGGPSWFKKKKAAEKEEQQEQQLKDAEKPVVGPGSPSDASNSAGAGANPFSQLSVPAGPPPETNLLFKRRGLTDSLSLDAGSLSQPDLNGPAFSVQYGMGWWWKPNLILSGFARETTIFADTYFFIMGGIGPEIRYLLTKHWALSGLAQYAFSAGLNRVSVSHIPPPPADTALGSRSGPMAGGQVAYLFWVQRDFAVGPALSYWVGQQSERTQSLFTIGLTYQSGRPNYTGDVTAW